MRAPPRYKIICVSMYRTDLDELDHKVEALRDRGWTHISRSKLIRIALAHMDITTLVTRAQIDALAIQIRTTIRGVDVDYDRPFDASAPHYIEVVAHGRTIVATWREGDRDVSITTSAEGAPDVRVPVAMALDTIAGLVGAFAADETMARLAARRELEGAAG